MHRGFVGGCAWYNFCKILFIWNGLDSQNKCVRSPSLQHPPVTSFTTTQTKCIGCVYMVGTWLQEGKELSEHSHRHTSFSNTHAFSDLSAGRQCQSCWLFCSRHSQCLRNWSRQFSLISLRL